MKFLRLAALISAAQIGVVIILFSFAVAAHAATVFSIGSPVDSTSAALSSPLTYPFKYLTSHFTYTGPTTTLTGGRDEPGSGSPYASNCAVGSMQIYHDTGSGVFSGGLIAQLTASTTAASPYCTYDTLVGGTGAITNGWSVYVVIDPNPATGATFQGTAAGSGSAGYADATGAYFTPGGTSISDFLVEFSGSGGFPPADTSTRIVPIDPGGTETATTSASTTVSFSAQYYNNSADTLASQGFQYDRLSLYLNRVDAASSTQVYFPGVVGDTLTSTSTTLVLPSNSAWTYDWCFEGPAPWGEISGLCTPTQDLYVESNPLPVLIGATSTSDLTGLATTTCGILNPTGCVQNAMAFLFYPNPSVFENFKTLQGSVRSHAPFGYVYVMISAINGTSGSSTPNFVLDIATTTQTVFFDPIRNGIAAVLWALAAFWFFKRIRDLHL